LIRKVILFYCHVNGPSEPACFILVISWLSLG